MKIDFRLPVEHLQSFMDREVPITSPSRPTGAKGECFHRSVALALDVPVWSLCIGTLSGATEAASRADPRKSPTEYIHCWIEFNDSVIDPSLLEKDDFKLHEYVQSSYYSVTGARNVRRIEGRRVKELGRTFAWNRRFLDREPFDDDQLVTTLLNEAAVPYEISARGGVVPLGVVIPDYARLKSRRPPRRNRPITMG